MNLEKLFEAQRALDERIVREKGLEGQDLLPNKILALQVELGELANEWRGFKHWSNNREPRREERIIDQVAGGNQIFNIVVGTRDPLLEEYVDCLHFLLSIGLEIGVHEAWKIIESEYKISEAEYKDTLKQLSYLFTIFVMVDGLYKENGLRHNIGLQDWFNFFDQFVRLGEMLGLDWDEVEAAYFAKNKVNHARQESGY